MRALVGTAVVCRGLSLVAAVVAAGCDFLPKAPPSAVPEASNAADVHVGYAPAAVRVVGLTSFVGPTGGAGIEAYIDLIDAFGSRVKCPAVFRFELYEYVPRSSESRGRRVQAWPDLDLRQADLNHQYWRDFLRTYQFHLPLDGKSVEPGVYILEATCLTTAGKRLSGSLQLRYPQ